MKTTSQIKTMKDSKVQSNTDEEAGDERRKLWGEKMRLGKIIPQMPVKLHVLVFIPVAWGSFRGLGQFPHSWVNCVQCF